MSEIEKELDRLGFDIPNHDQPCRCFGCVSAKSKRGHAKRRLRKLVMEAIVGQMNSVKNFDEPKDYWAWVETKFGLKQKDLKP